MKSFCIGVLSGCLLSLFLPIVPPFFVVFFLLPLFFILLKYGVPVLAGVTAFLACFIWQYHAYQQAQDALLAASGPLTGVISDTPQHYPEYSQFTLKLDAETSAGYYVTLNWSAPAVVLQQGQRWQLHAGLRPIAGVANPGGPNKELAAMIDGIIAQGSVKAPAEAVLLNAEQSRRSRLLDKIIQVVQPFETAPLLLALTVGERQFQPELWLGLQKSGLAHLVAISGLHVGLVFGWVLLLFRILPWPLGMLHWRRPVALLCALLLATSYAWLAGFAIPTVRATLALLLLVVALIQSKSLNYLSYWLLLAAILLLVQPMFVLSKSFWLSMLAVAVIFFVLWRRPFADVGWQAKLTAFLGFHLTLTLFMSLLSFLMFDGSAGLSLLSNLLFVPWCSLLAIPVLILCLLAELSGITWSAVLWQVCDVLFKPLLWWLNWCAEHGNWLVLPDLPVLIIIVLLLLSVLYLLIGLSRLLFLAPLLLLLVAQQLLKAPLWQLHIIDVGQGLAVLLQHGRHGLLYDAGPRYGDYSATSAQVIPYLRQRGIIRLDYLLLSHDDSDHTGQWHLLKRAYPKLQIYTDIANVPAALPCERLPGYFFQAKLSVLYSYSAANKNDSSCVLMISLNGWNILLPGDISQREELELLQHYPALRANVLVLSHHGSNSSSHLAFLHQLAPQLALNSASLYNRHQHPAWQVRQRLAMVGIPLFNTAHSGALTLTISNDNLELTEYRAQRIPFWQQKPSTNAETLVTTR